MRETKHISQIPLDDIAADESGGKTLEDLRQAHNRKALVNWKDSLNDHHIENWKKFFSDIGKPPRKGNFIGPEPLIQQIDFETARHEFRELIKDRSVEIAIAKNVSEYKIELTKEQGAVVIDLLKWLINDPSGNLDIAKGWWLYGEPGTFKSELANLLRRYAQNRRLFKMFHFTDWSLEYDTALMDGKSDIIMVNEQHFRCLDEFGRKAMPINRFGNKVDANESIIESRYIRFKKYRQFTMFVSNYDPAQIKSVLSPMAFDRLTEMAKSIRMPGKSHRK